MRPIFISTDHTLPPERTARIGRSLLVSLFVLVSLVPFNYLQYIQIQMGHWSVPFYYPLLSGLALLTLALALCHRPSVSIQALMMPLLMALAPTLSAMAKFHRFGLHHSLASFLLLGPMTVLSTILCFRRTDQITEAVDVLVMIGVLVAGLGIAEALIHRNVLYHGLFFLKNTYYTAVLPYRGGVASTIGHALPLGAYLVLILPLSFALEKKWGAGIFFFSFSIIFLGLLITLTRSSWIASSFVLIAALFCAKKSWMPILLAAGFCVITFLAASRSIARAVNRQETLPDVPLLGLLKERLDLFNLRSEMFHSHRSASYKVASRTLYFHPIFGVGYGNYPKIYKEVQVDGIQTDIPTPDNQFLRWLVENGLVGFCIFLIFWAWFLAQYVMVKLESPPNETTRLLTVLAIGMGGFLINLMAWDGFFWLATNFTFWFITGLAISLMEICKTQNPGQAA